MPRSRQSACWIVSAWLFAPATALPQMLMHSLSSGGTVQLMGSDAAILDMGETRKDLPCIVTPVNPLLGFDLRFHSGYDILMPLRELAGDGDELTIIFRVTPAAEKDSPSYFISKYNVPSIEADAKGDAYLQGGFDIGEGDYHVDWMMRDRVERVCSSSWDIKAALQPKDQGMKLPIAPAVVEASEREFFKEEPPVARVEPEKALKVKVLINFAPQQDAASTMLPIDTSALVSILRNISREPMICKFSVVAFNMNEQRIVYRQDDADQIDFPEMGRALGSIRLGMIDYRKLTDKHGASDFLAKLISDELASNTSDAVIFAGPKIMLEDSFPAENLNELSGIRFPVFYMNYNLTPIQNPWRDMIGTVVKKLKGYEYTISRPRDLWTSWSDIMGRIVKMKLVAQPATSSH